jgi:hypothetical protein
MHDIVEDPTEIHHSTGRCLAYGEHLLERWLVCMVRDDKTRSVQCRHKSTICDFRDGHGVYSGVL